MRSESQAAMSDAERLVSFFHSASSDSASFSAPRLLVSSAEYLAAKCGSVEIDSSCLTAADLSSATSGEAEEEAVVEEEEESVLA